MKLSTKIVAGFGSLATVLAIASTGNPQGFADGKGFANNILNQVNQNAEKDSKNINKLLPNLDANADSQKQLFDNPRDLNDQGLQKASKQGTTESYAYDTMNKHANDTRYTVDPNSPMMQNLNSIDKNVTNLITNNYQGCTTLPYQQNNTIFRNKSCVSTLVSSGANFTCTKKFTSICQNPLAGQPKVFKLEDFKITHLNALAKKSSLPVKQMGVNKFQFGKYGDNYRSPGKGCNWYEDEISFDAKGKEITKFFISKIRYDDWIEIVVNGEVAVSDTNGGCERKRTSSRPDTDISDKLNKGVNKIKIRHQVSGGGEIAFLFDIESEEPCNAKEDYQTTCNAGYNPYSSDSKLIKKQCTGGTKLNENDEEVCIEEVSEYQTTKSTWLQEKSCQQIKNETCKVVKSTCLKTDANGNCIEQKEEYKCPTKSTTEDQVICGDTLICQDGNCSNDMGREQIDGTDDFKQAMASLGVAEELAQGINESMISIFKSKGQKCKKKPFGVADCCKDSGWGLDFSLAQCSSEEKEIGIAKEDERTHYIGSYTKKEDSLGLVKSTIKTYCVYPSKLARIIAVQGKQQLGQSFGSAKNPNCSGFTIEEIQKLDFNAMDLSEFYSNVMENQKNNTNAPTTGGAIKKIQDSLNNRFQSN